MCCRPTAVDFVLLIDTIVVSRHLAQVPVHCMHVPYENITSILLSIAGGSPAVLV